MSRGTCSPGVPADAAAGRSAEATEVEEKEEGDAAVATEVGLVEEKAAEATEVGLVEEKAAAATEVATVEVETADATGVMAERAALAVGKVAEATAAAARVAAAMARAVEVLVAMEAGANAGRSQCSRSRGRRRICTHSLVSSLQSLAHRRRRCLDWRKSTYWCRSDLRAAGARGKAAGARAKVAV